jgi:hypothetical protein
MSPSRLEVSPHAIERLKQRLITRENVRLCLAEGLLVSADISGRLVKEKKIGKKTLVVVYINELGGQMLVTAYWKGV